MMLPGFGRIAEYFSTPEPVVQEEDGPPLTLVGGALALMAVVGAVAYHRFSRVEPPVVPEPEPEPDSDSESSSEPTPVIQPQPTPRIKRVLEREGLSDKQIPIVDKEATELTAEDMGNAKLVVGDDFIAQPTETGVAYIKVEGTEEKPHYTIGPGSPWSRKQTFFEAALDNAAKGEENGQSNEL